MPVRERVGRVHVDHLVAEDARRVDARREQPVAGERGGDEGGEGQSGGAAAAAQSRRLADGAAPGEVVTLDGAEASNLSVRKA
jgi:hypothetical protein